jgi:ATP-dependent DNA helicase RecQ
MLKYTSHDGTAPEKSDGGAREKAQNPAAPEKRNGGDSELIDSLTAEQKQLFDAMRSWRLKRAQAIGVAVYLISNNKQLAVIARAKPTNIVALSALEGIKPSFVRDYGAEILELCRQS